MRKIVTLIVAGGAVVLAYFRDKFGLQGLQIEQVLIALVPALIFLAFEAKADILRIKEALAQQSHKWRDGKFWGGLLTVLVPYLNEALGWNLPVEVITGIVGVLVSLFFGKTISDIKKASIT